MNALCSLSPGARIRFSPKGAQPVLLMRMHDGERAGAIREADGVFTGTIQVNGWVLIQHPRAGLVGLPLEGVGSSWHTAWDDMLVDIQYSQNGKWNEPIDDWNELTVLYQNT